MSKAIVVIADLRVEAEVPDHIDSSVHAYFQIRGESCLTEIGAAVGEHALGSFTSARPHPSDPYQPYPGTLTFAGLTCKIPGNWFDMLRKYRKSVSLDEVLRNAVINTLNGTAPKESHSPYGGYPWQAATPAQTALIRRMIDAGLPPPTTAEALLKYSASAYIRANQSEFEKFAGLPHYKLVDLVGVRSDRLERWLQRNGYLDERKCPTDRGLEQVETGYRILSRDFRWKWGFVDFLKAQPDLQPRPKRPRRTSEKPTAGPAAAPAEAAPAPSPSKKEAGLKVEPGDGGIWNIVDQDGTVVGTATSNAAAWRELDRLWMRKPGRINRLGGQSAEGTTYRELTGRAEDR